MKRKWQRIILVLSLMVLAFFLAAYQPQAPLPPEVIVNHTLKQCAVVILGDECGNCEIPEGWESIGRSGDVSCPTDYEKVQLTLECKGFAEARCILPGHSGMRGDFWGWLRNGLLCIVPCLILLTGIILLVVLLLRKRKKQRQQEQTHVEETGASS